MIKTLILFKNENMVSYMYNCKHMQAFPRFLETFLELIKAHAKTDVEPLVASSKRHL